MRWGADTGGASAEVRAMSDQIITGFRESNSAMLGAAETVKDAAKTVKDAGKTMQDAAVHIGGRPPADDDDDKPTFIRRIFRWGRRPRRPSRAPRTGPLGRAPTDPNPAADGFRATYPPQPMAPPYQPGAAPAAPQVAWPEPYRAAPPAARPMPEAPERTIYLGGQGERLDGTEPFRRD